MNGEACVMQLLRDIDGSAAVQACMRQASLELELALRGVSAPWQSASCSDPAESGAVAPEDARAALLCGNLRERCQILYNLLHAGGGARVVRELVQLCERGAAGTAGLHLPHLRRVAAAAHAAAPWELAPAEAQRWLRAPREWAALALPRCRAVPALSSRELRVQRAGSGVLRWTTGRMRWTVLPASEFARDAQRRGESVVAGRSGHTHALLGVARVFRSFRVELWLLISLVWLVGADHHSVHEVVDAARHHGLRTPALASSVAVARAVLRGVDAQWAADRARGAGAASCGGVQRATRPRPRAGVLAFCGI